MGSEGNDVSNLWEDVLGLDEGSVGEDDSFFSLGGNSLLAVQMVNRLNQAHGTSVPVSQLFEKKTVKAFMDNFSNNENVYNAPPIVPVDRSNPESLQLSFQQERVWVWDQYAQGLPSMNVSMFLEVLPGFSLEKFTHAFKTIVQRHDILRTVLKTNKEGKAYQTLTSTPFEVTTQSIKKSEQQVEFVKFLNTEFDLSKDLSIKVTAYKVDGELKYIGIVGPHIAFDLWSRDVMIRELISIYNNGDDRELPKVEVQYVDYAQHQRASMTGENLENHLTHWKETLDGYELLVLPYDRPKDPNGEYYTGKCVNLELNETLSNTLRALASELDVSLYAVLLGGFSLMLHAVTKLNDILLAAPLARRDNAQIDQIVGFFMSPLPLRQKIDLAATIQAFIKSLWNGIALVNKYQYLNPEHIMQAVGHTSDPYKDRDDLCRIYFQVQDSIFEKVGTDLNIPARLFNVIDEFVTPANGLDLTAVLYTSNPVIGGILVYSDELFNEDTVVAFKDSFISILSQFAGLVGKSDSTKISELNLSTTFSAEKELAIKLQLDNTQAVNGNSDHSEETFTIPSTEKEKAICKIWANVLDKNTSEFGITQDFFKNGGNGLLGTTVLVLMKEQLGVEVTLKELYANRTVQRVAALRSSTK